MTLVAKSLKALISAYQATKFLRQPTCRFYPSCSHYAYQTIDRHGALQGVMLAASRMGKCHPFHPGGVDEVPESVNFEWIGAGPLVGKFKRLTREL